MYTYHDSCAVVECGNIFSECVEGNRITAKFIWISREKMVCDIGPLWHINKCSSLAGDRALSYYMTDGRRLTLHA